MTKVGVVSDIHANLPALQAVLHELEETHSVDKIVCVGDIVGVLGSPSEVVTLVREKTDVQVCGNHDTRFFPTRDWVPEEDYEIAEYEQVTSSLTDEQMEWLTSLPTYEVMDDTFHVAHCNPLLDDETGVETGDAGIHPKDYISVGGQVVDGGVLVFGHTHYQHAVLLDKFAGQSGLVLNPGSVGFPYKDNGPASYGVVDTETLTYHNNTIEYDTSSVEEHIKSCGLQ